MNITQELKHVEDKIRKLEAEHTKVDFALAVEKAVFSRLKALDVGNRASLFGNPQAVTMPGSMPSHVEAVLIASGKPMRISAIVEAVRKRGAVSNAPKGIKNNVRGTLKRRDDLFVRHERGIYKLKQWAEKTPET